MPLTRLIAAQLPAIRMRGIGPGVSPHAPGRHAVRLLIAGTVRVGGDPSPDRSADRAQAAGASGSKASSTKIGMSRSVFSWYES